MDRDSRREERNVSFSSTSEERNLRGNEQEEKIREERKKLFNFLSTNFQETRERRKIIVER